MPAFYISNKQIQLKLISFINVILVNLGIFPVYLLSKKVIKNIYYTILYYA